MSTRHSGISEQFVLFLRDLNVFVAVLSRFDIISINGSHQLEAIRNRGQRSIFDFIQDYFVILRVNFR